jgi:hypothetical protein
LPNRIEQSILEHRATIEALERRDKNALEKLVVDHLLSSKNSYLSQLIGTGQKGKLRKVKLRPMRDDGCGDDEVRPKRKAW